jgi:hypothetical protein
MKVWENANQLPKVEVSAGTAAACAEEWGCDPIDGDFVVAIGGGSGGALVLHGSRVNIGRVLRRAMDALDQVEG